MNLKNRINSFFSINLVPFTLSKADQVRLLSQYSEPKDLMERSYFQFKIQFNLFPIHKRFSINIVGFFALLYFLPVAIFSRKEKANEVNVKPGKKLGVFPYKNYHYPNVIPNEVKHEFEIEEINNMSGFSIKYNDVKFIFRIFVRYPFQMYFLSKCVSKILFYRHILNLYNPDAIVCSSEYSFISSVSTLYCRLNKVEHINIMHGEKFYFVRDSFFEFDRFYVWDRFYKELFTKLKAQPSQFLVGTYSHLKMNLSDCGEKYSFTYYLAAEDNATLYKIKSVLEKIDDTKNICIRFHPRYSSQEVVQSIFKGFNIENPMNVSLEESFSCTKNVISLYSSCLTQAFFNGKNIVIDDLSHSSEKLRTLKESDYIIFKKPHRLLSDFCYKKDGTNIYNSV